MYVLKGCQGNPKPAVVMQTARHHNNGSLPNIISLLFAQNKKIWHDVLCVTLSIIVVLMSRLDGTILFQKEKGIYNNQAN